MKPPRYPKYKDSGVKWLGQVPEHWEVRRLKYVARLVTEKAIEKTNPVALENIEGWSGRLIPSETEYQGDGVAFLPGDILFGKLRPYLAKAHLAQVNGEAVGDFHVLRPVDEALGSFLLYYLLNKNAIDIIDGSTFGSKMPRVSWQFLANMVIAIPPDADRPSLTAFLDRELAKIDALIEEQRRLIDLLKEKRQAAISRTVTKGVNAPPPNRRWLRVTAGSRINRPCGRLRCGASQVDFEGVVPRPSWL